MTEPKGGIVLANNAELGTLDSATVTDNIVKSNRLDNSNGIWLNGADSGGNTTYFGNVNVVGNQGKKVTLSRFVAVSLILNASRLQCTTRSCGASRRRARRRRGWSSPRPIRSTTQGLRLRKWRKCLRLRK